MAAKLNVAAPLLIDGTEYFGLESAGDFANPPGLAVLDYSYRKSRPITDISWLKESLQLSWWRTSVGFEIYTHDWFTDAGADLPRATDQLSAGLAQADDMCSLYSETQLNYSLLPGDVGGLAPPASATEIAAVASAVNANPTKRLLYNPAFITPDNWRPSAARYAQIESHLRDLPFHGYVFTFKLLNDPYDAALDFLAFSSTAISTAGLQARLTGFDIGDKKLYSAILPDLLQTTATPGPTTADYFDSSDLQVRYDNIQKLSQVMKADGRFGGFWLDTESYSGVYSKYSVQKYHGSKTLAEYQDQCVAVGYNFGQIMLSEFPDIEVYNLVPPFYSKSGSGQDTNNELLGPLVAGIAKAFQESQASASTSPGSVGLRMSSASLGS